MNDPLTQLRDWLASAQNAELRHASSLSGMSAEACRISARAYSATLEKLDSLTADADAALAKRLAVHHLTPMQMRVAVAIAKYWQANHMGPTMQELADELGVSKVTIFEHAEALERKGAVVRKKHTSRALAVVGGAA